MLPIFCTVLLLHNTSCGGAGGGGGGGRGPSEVKAIFFNFSLLLPLNILKISIVITPFAMTIPKIPMVTTVLVVIAVAVTSFAVFVF